MMPGLVDHLLIVLIAVLYPVYASIIWFRRVRPRLEAKETGALVRVYCENMIELWLLTAVVLSWWFWAGRVIVGIGFGIPGGWAFWIGVIVIVVFVIALGYQLSVVRSSAEARAKVRKQLGGSTALMVPRNRRERRMAVALSLTAGFCEEVLYRGFFMWYLMAWFPGLAAVAISAVVFGVAHLYQGWGGVLKTTAVGVIFGVAYLLTGSLWVPIILHVMLDVSSLLTGSVALEHGKSDAASGSQEDGGA